MSKASFMEGRTFKIKGKQPCCNLRKLIPGEEESSSLLSSLPRSFFFFGAKIRLKAILSKFSDENPIFSQNQFAGLRPV